MFNLACYERAVFSHIYIHRYTLIYIHIQACLYIETYLHVYNIYACLHSYIYVYMHICKQIFIEVCWHMYIFVSIVRTKVPKVLNNSTITSIPQEVYQ